MLSHKNVLTMKKKIKKSSERLEAVPSGFQVDWLTVLAIDTRS